MTRNRIVGKTSPLKVARSGATLVTVIDMSPLKLKAEKPRESVIVQTHSNTEPGSSSRKRAASTSNPVPSRADCKTEEQRDSVIVQNPSTKPDSTSDPAPAPSQASSNPATPEAMVPNSLETDG